MMSLIGTLIVVIVVTVFAGFNKDYTCSINLLYRTFDNVPVFLAIMASFVAGVIVALPYVFVRRHARKVKIEKAEKQVESNEKVSEAKPVSATENKFSLFSKKKKDEEKPSDNISATDGEKHLDTPNEAAVKSE